MVNFGVFLHLDLLFFFMQSHVRSKHFLIKTEDSPGRSLNRQGQIGLEDFESRSTTPKSTGWTNGGLDLGLFEGDIMLTDRQLSALKAASLEPRGDLGKVKANRVESVNKNALVNENKRWEDNTIKFEFDSSMDEDSKNQVRTTLQKLHEDLDKCIRFEETNEGFRLIVKSKDGRGCDSYVGKIGGGSPQPLNLEKSRCMSPATIMHEFLHAVGLHHTRGRSDRDDYLTILWDNMESGEDTKAQFKKYEPNVVTHFNLPYDYDSIMHYSDTAFGKKTNGIKKITIETKDPTKQETIGQRTRLSPGDIALVKKMYKCDGNEEVSGCLIEEKISYHGNDLEQFKNVPSKEECAEKAAAVKDAKFWTYKPKSKTCYSKTSMEGKKANPDGVSGNVECANGQKEKVEKDGEEKEGCVIEEKIDYIGHDIKSFQNVENHSDCAKKAAKYAESAENLLTTAANEAAKKAAENAQAKFWTYVTSSKECWIKRSNKEKKPLKTAVSGNVECGQ